MESTWQMQSFNVPFASWNIFYKKFIFLGRLENQSISMPTSRPRNEQKIKQNYTSSLLCHQSQLYKFSQENITNWPTCSFRMITKIQHFHDLPYFNEHQSGRQVGFKFFFQIFRLICAKYFQTKKPEQKRVDIRRATMGTELEVLKGTFPSSFKKGVQVDRANVTVFSGFNILPWIIMKT